MTGYHPPPPHRALLALAVLACAGLAATQGRAGDTTGPCPAPAAWSEPLAAELAADGSLDLSDATGLSLPGIAVPTRLSPVPGLAAAAQAAARDVLDGHFIRVGAGGTDRHHHRAAPALRLPAVESDRGEDLVVILLTAGAGYAVPHGPKPCADRLLNAEADARAAGRGLWSVPGAVAQGRSEADVGLRAGLYTVAEGRISAAGATRDRVFLNFGERWREDFTVIMDRDDFSTIFGDGLDPALLRGTLVRVRGVVREEGGPAIFVRSGGSISRLSARESVEAPQQEGGIGREVGPR